MLNRMVVYYKENDRDVLVYIGTYQECFSFYVKNKAKYLDQNLYLGFKTFK